MPIVRTLLLLLVVVAAGGGAIGCTSNNLYFPPKLPDSEVAKLRAKGGLRISKIDGMSLQSGPTITVLGTSGSNETAAFPGRRELELSKAFGNGSSNYRMILDLAKGSAYEFESISFGRRVAVTNTTAGRRWEFDYQTLSAFDPSGNPQPLDKPIAP